MENTNKTDIKLPISETSAFEHKEAVDDDCGLPQNPIYANYPKYLWKRTHSGFHPNESEQKSKTTLNPKSL
jgi:hypothetical protein